MLKRSKRKVPVQRLSEENLGWTSSKEIKIIGQEQFVKDMPESNHNNINVMIATERL